MADFNENDGTGAPGAGEGGNEGGDDQFELNEDGTPVLGEDGKPKPKAGEGKDGQQREPETPDARRARLARQLDQHDKKHKLGKYADGASSQEEPSKKSGLDYGQKAFLIASDVKAPEEHALAERLMKETGKELETLVSSTYFKTELKELREARAAEDAIPDSRRSGQPRANSVEFWLAKGELPPDSPENRELRQKVVKARRTKESSGDVFSKNPVQGNV